MIDYLTQIEDKIYDSIRKILNYNNLEDTPLFFSHLNIPEPQETYCVIYVTGEEQTGSASESHLLKASNNGQTAVSHHIVDVQISVFGEESSGVSSRLRWCLDNDRRAYDAFGFNKARVFSVGRGVRPNPSLREDKWVKGFNFDFRVSMSLYNKYEYHPVDAITINGERVDLPYKN